MARKPANLAEARAGIKKEYKRGSRSKRAAKITSESALAEIDRATKREAACFLKATDFSYTYIADSLNLTVDIVKKWFQDEAMVARVAEIQIDFSTGATKLLKTYAIELVEMLVEIARRTDDDSVALKAIVEALDRIGITKVSKVELPVASPGLSDGTGEAVAPSEGALAFLAQLRTMPPQVAAQIAAQAADIDALAREHSE